MPKPAGITFNRYATIAGKTLRRALKPEALSKVSGKDEFDVRVQKWENGKAGEPEHLQISLKKE